jgi:hypothetical protein
MAAAPAPARPLVPPPGHLLFPHPAETVVVSGSQRRKAVRRGLPTPWKIWLVRFTVEGAHMPAAVRHRHRRVDFPDNRYHSLPRHLVPLPAERAEAQPFVFDPQSDRVIAPWPRGRETGASHGSLDALGQQNPDFRLGGKLRSIWIPLDHAEMNAGVLLIEWSMALSNKASTSA